MVLPREHILVTSSSDGESLLKLTKEVEDTLSKVEETIVNKKDTLENGVEAFAKPKEKSMDWFRKMPKLVDQLKIDKEECGFSKEANIESENKTLKKLNIPSQSIKDKTTKISHKNEKEIEGIAKDRYNSISEILELNKDKTFENICRTQDSTYNGVEGQKESLENVLIGAKDKTCDVGVNTKDMISNIARFSKDEVNNGVHHIEDTIIDNLQLELDEIKSTSADVFDKIREVVKYSTQNTKDIDHGILERPKDAAYKIAECLQLRSQEAGTYVPNLGQGVGHVYSEGQALKEASTNICGNIEEIGQDAKSNVGDFVNSGMDFDKQSYNKMKNVGDYYYHEKRGSIDESYDFTTNAHEDCYDKVGQDLNKGKNSPDGSTNYYNHRGGRCSYKGARDFSGKSFYDIARADGYFDNINDKTKHAFDGVYHRTKHFYNNARDKINGYIPNKHEEGSRDYLSMTSQEIANGHRNAPNQDEGYYKNEKVKSGKDLGAMVESMGWLRVGIVASDHVPISLDDEVIIGNVKYEWNDKGQSILFMLHSILHPWFVANSVEQWELSNFGLMIVSTIINAYVLQPQSTKVMFNRLKVEKEEGRGLENLASPMDAKLIKEEHKKKLANFNQEFKTLQNYSSTLNLISFGGLTCHLWHLAHHLVI